MLKVVRAVRVGWVAKGARAVKGAKAVKGARAELRVFVVIPLSLAPRHATMATRPTETVVRKIAWSRPATVAWVARVFARQAVVTARSSAAKRATMATWRMAMVARPRVLSRWVGRAAD